MNQHPMSLRGAAASPTANLRLSWLDQLDAQIDDALETNTNSLETVNDIMVFDANVKDILRQFEAMVDKYLVQLSRLGRHHEGEQYRMKCLRNSRHYNRMLLILNGKLKWLGADELSSVGTARTDSRASRKSALTPLRHTYTFGQEEDFGANQTQQSPIFNEQGRVSGPNSPYDPLNTNIELGTNEITQTGFPQADFGANFTYGDREVFPNSLDVQPHLSETQPTFDPSQVNAFANMQSLCNELQALSNDPQADAGRRDTTANNYQQVVQLDSNMGAHYTPGSVISNNATVAPITANASGLNFSANLPPLAETGGVTDFAALFRQQASTLMTNEPLKSHYSKSVATKLLINTKGDGAPGAFLFSQKRQHQVDQVLSGPTQPNTGVGQITAPTSGIACSSIPSVGHNQGDIGPPVPPRTGLSLKGQGPGAVPKYTASVITPNSTNVTVAQPTLAANLTSRNTGGNIFIPISLDSNAPAKGAFKQVRPSPVRASPQGPTGNLGVSTQQVNLTGQGTGSSIKLAFDPTGHQSQSIPSPSANLHRPNQLPSQDSSSVMKGSHSGFLSSPSQVNPNTDLYRSTLNNLPNNKQDSTTSAAIGPSNLGSKQVGGTPPLIGGQKPLGPKSVGFVPSFVSQNQQRAPSQGIAMVQQPAINTPASGVHKYVPSFVKSGQSQMPPAHMSSQGQPSLSQAFQPQGSVPQGISQVQPGYSQTSQPQVHAHMSNQGQPSLSQASQPQGSVQGISPVQPGYSQTSQPQVQTHMSNQGQPGYHQAPQLQGHGHPAGQAAFTLPHSFGQGMPNPYMYNQAFNPYGYPYQGMPLPMAPGIWPQSSYQNPNPLRIMTNHLLEESLVSKSIPKFDGVAYEFYPWAGKLESYIEFLGLQDQPLKIMQLLESNTVGDAQEMVTSEFSATGRVTFENVSAVWEKLVHFYGDPTIIAGELSKRVEAFSSVTEDMTMGRQLAKLHSLCNIILHNQQNCSMLEIYNNPVGLEPLRRKLPESVQRKWANRGKNYEKVNGRLPPFSEFVSFLLEVSKDHANTNYMILPRSDNKGTSARSKPKILKTDINPNGAGNLAPGKPENTGEEQKKGRKSGCVYHNGMKGHNITNCKGFGALSYEDKVAAAIRLNICSRCLYAHKVEDCYAKVSCDICEGRHATAMHKSKQEEKKGSKKKDEEKATSKKKDKPSVEVKCTQVCDSSSSPRSCSKTLLCELSMDGVPGQSLPAYVILDEQANMSIVDERVVDFFGVEFPSQEYTMKFASQECELNWTGKLVTGLRVRGVNEEEQISIPSALTCPEISDTTSEVASPQMVSNIRSVSHYARHFPEFNPEVDVLLLLGRNCGRAMHTQCLTDNEPYLHRTPLGFCLVGSVCDSDKEVSPVSIKKTHVNSTDISYNFDRTPRNIHALGTFEKHPDDEVTGLSVENRHFMSLMESNIRVRPNGSIELPLPLRDDNLPDNRSAVLLRTTKTLAALSKKPVRLEACLSSMQKSIDAGFVEEVPQGEVHSSSKAWYNPIFCVEQIKRSKGSTVTKHRLVFDVSAKFKGVSLNQKLYQGPDLNNQLRGVLLRFRERPVAFGADLTNMFSNFKVPESQHDMLRFFWFKDNAPSGQIVDYRSTSHIFGCTSSPSVANCALKFCAAQVQSEEPDLHHYLDRGFYVDDGLGCTETSSEAISILQRCAALLKKYNIGLHKIISNSPEVLAQFPESERANIADIPSDQQFDCSTLGVKWNTMEDAFILRPSIPKKPFTKRGVLSCVHSLYDPIGMCQPVVLMAKIFQREVLTNTKELGAYGWDDALPSEFFSKWCEWLDLLKDLEHHSIPRSFYPLGTEPVLQELFIFVDASEQAIGLVAYMRTIDTSHNAHVCFVFASSKLCPRGATTMPRLELNAALEGARCGRSICNELDQKPSNVYLFSDSRIVLGYIANETRSFSKYVERRTSIIRDMFPSENWRYIASEENPADLASRPHKPNELLMSCWFSGPDFLRDPNFSPQMSPREEVGKLPEEKREIAVLVATNKVEGSPFDDLFSRRSSFSMLTRVAFCVLLFLNKMRKVVESPTDLRQRAIRMLVREAQKSHYSVPRKVLALGHALPENSQLSKLSLFLDSDGLLRVGGRLKRADMPASSKHPYLLPPKHPLALSIASHIHHKILHRGSQMSHSALMQEGFFIENGRQFIRQMVNKCVVCRKLRARPCQQLMSDLPLVRIEETPPFTHIGLDVFGHFFIHDGKTTRRSNASKKVWVLICVCLPSRAVHLEMLPDMSTDAFQNAFTRFVRARGMCVSIISDQGSNFLGARKQMADTQALNVDVLSREFEREGISWKLNPPKASHFSGAWEIKIASVRRCLEAALLLVSNRGLSRDEFTTLLAESSAIVNNTPLYAPSADPNDPLPITPAMLLTLKDNPCPPPLESYSESDILQYGAKRYRRVQYLSCQFWSRWRKEYLQTLHQRHKWQTIKPCVTVGDIVLIRDKQIPRNQWPLGVVDSVNYSEDDLVRSVRVRQTPLPNSSKPRFKDRAISDIVLLIPAKDHPCFLQGEAVSG